MIKGISIFLLALSLSISLHGQNVDSLGIDNNPNVNSQEAKFLNSQFKNVSDTIDFSHKKVAFYLCQAGYIEKQHYFNDAKKYNEEGHEMSLQLIQLNQSEKEMTNGFDVIIVVWDKFIVNQKYRTKLINGLTTISKK